MNFQTRSRKGLFDILFLEFVLYFLILFSPSIYGGITFSPLAIIELSGLLFFFAYFSRACFSKDISLMKLPIGAVLIFIFLIFFQLIKIPVGLINLISPSTAKVYQNFLSSTVEYASLSICPEATISLFLQILIYLAVFLVVINFINSESRAKRVIAVIIISGLVFSLAAFFNKLYVPGKLFSTFTNPNHFAAYIQIIIFLTIGFALSFKNNIARFILLFFASVMIAALFYSQSRAGKLCLLFGFVLFFLVLKFKNVSRKFNPWLLAPVLFLIVLILVIGATPFFQRMETLSNPFVEYYGRFIIILDSLRLSRDFPVFGTGLGTFNEIIQKYKSLGWASKYGFSHNEPVQLLAETGIIGFSLILFFLFSIFKKIFSSLIKRNNEFIIYTVTGGLVGLITVSLQSFFDFIFHVPSILLLFFIVLGILYRLVNINRHGSEESQGFLVIQRNSIMGISLITVSLVLSGYLGSIIISRYKAEVLFNEIKNKEVIELDGVDEIFAYKKIIKRLDKVILLNSLNGKYFYMKGDIFAKLATLDSLSEELIALDDLGSKEELLSKAEKNIKKSINLNPTNADYHFKLGWIYNKLGEKDLANNEFNKAISLDRMNSPLMRLIDECSKKKDC